MVDQRAIHDFYSSTYLPLNDPVNQFRRISAVAEYISKDDTRLEDLRRWFGIFKSKFEASKNDLRREGRPIFEQVDERQAPLWSRLLTQRKENTEASLARPDFSAASEYLLNCFQIAKTARSMSTEGLKREYISLDRDIRTNGTWLERSFLGQISPERNTFLLSYDIEAAIAQTREDTAGSHSDRPSLQISSDILERVLTSLERGAVGIADRRLERSLNNIRRYGADLYSRKFEQLSYIHHEISENAMAHAIDSPFNDRMNEDLSSFFGMLFYCQVSAVRVSQRTPINKQSSIHPKFPEYVGALRSINRKQDQYLYAITYCDTGPGILRHVRRFATDTSNETGVSSIRYMMENQVSTRAFSGSGLGLRKIREFTSSLDGFLIIETSGQTYTYDSLTSAEHEGVNANTRGTMLTLMFPVD